MIAVTFEIQESEFISFPISLSKNIISHTTECDINQIV